ncbi:MAG TPA: hypothetical protein VE669_11325, partial [Actinomycetota bacterium]|nr:hypothetical protein [Actinomycetota bacterium]
DYFYLTSSKNLSIYDVSTPEDPQLVSYTPLGLPEWENEDVATNGKILIISQTGNIPLIGGGENAVHVWDVTDKAEPVEIGTTSGIGQHTMTCVNDCAYLYGSGGNIVDLSDPTNPKLIGNWAQKLGISSGHDVREEAPGIVVVSSGGGVNGPGAILDTTDPENPQLLSSVNMNERPKEYVHSTAWPNQAEDRFMLLATETNLSPQCGSSGTGNGSTYVMDMTDWRSGEYHRADRWQAKNGVLFDGSPPANALGCSAHWVEPSPAFHNGGVFAEGYYEHGTRFFYANGAGHIREAGYFVPYGGSTSAAHWITDRVVYAVDYTRGFDVLRWNGPLPSDPAEATDVTSLTASADGGVSGTATFLGESEPNVLAEDPLGDGPGGEQSSEQGVDITEASVSQPDATYPELEFTWTVSNLPNPVTGIHPEGVRYVWSFLAGGKQWFVQAKASAIAQSTLPDDPDGTVSKTTRAFQLRGNCGLLPPPPAPGLISSCGHVAWLDGSIDREGKTVTVRVPVGASFAPEIAPGATITPITVGGDQDIYAAAQAVADNTFTRDAVLYETSYTVPQGTVALGVAPAGSPASQVTFGDPIVVGPDGGFSGSVGSIPDGSAVYAKACFGTDCSVRTFPAP